MKPEQRSMTIIVPVLPGREEDLMTLLRGIGSDIMGNTTLQFAQFPTIHFARWAVIPPPDPPDASGTPSQLVFGTDHDGPDEALLNAAASNAMALNALDSIYSHCAGWPGKDNPTRVAEYFLTRRIPYGARHIACRRRTVQDLKAAVAARERMETAVDTAFQPGRAGQGQALGDGEASQKITDLRQRSAPLPDIANLPVNWQAPAAAIGAAAVVGGGLTWLFRRSPWWGLAGVGTLLGLGAAFQATLHQHEAADAKDWVEATPPTLKHLSQLRVWEDHQVQNQMTHVVAVKLGRFRRLTLNFVLAAIDFMARYHWNRGDLGGIPTIHFARWMLIDNGKRLLFFSNFDGSWENYLGDFIDRASAGLTGVWSNTVEFPKTHNLTQEGSQRAEAFKNWTRKHQIETQVWYSAYPQVSAVNLLDALALCEKPAPGAARELLGSL